MTPLLELRGVEAGYGQGRVLAGLSLTVGEGEMAGLLGRNGMGKTTTVRAVMGLTPLSAGRILFRGKDIGGQSADRIARAGIALAPEGRQIFPNLTVKENLIAFAANRHGSAKPWTLDRVLKLFPRLAGRLGNLGGRLSGGEQQMLAIGRALMTNPLLIILDEATEGLAPLVREEIWTCLARLRAGGQAALIIDKYVDRLIGLCDRHVIIEKGREAWSGTSAELAADHSVWHRYLGV